MVHTDDTPLLESVEEGSFSDPPFELDESPAEFIAAGDISDALADDSGLFSEQPSDIFTEDDVELGVETSIEGFSFSLSQADARELADTALLSQPSEGYHAGNQVRFGRRLRESCNFYLPISMIVCELELQCSYVSQLQQCPPGKPPDLC